MKKSDISINGVLPPTIREIIHNIQWGYDYDEELVTLIDDCSEATPNAMNTVCMVIDIHCEDGNLRIGYYSDNAQTVLDCCDGCESCEDWAKGWDRDGVVPEYLWGSEEDE